MIDLKYFLWTCLIAAVSLYVYRRIQSFLSRFKDIPKTADCNFIFGDGIDIFRYLLGIDKRPMYKLILDMSHKMSETLRCYPIITLWLGWFPYVVVYKAQWVDKILNSTEAIQKASEYDNLHPWLGTGLLTSHGRKWHIRRKMLSPAFHFRILLDFLPIFNEKSKILIEMLQKSVNKEIDIFHFVPLAALDIICETAMGVDLKSQTSPKSKYMDAVISESELSFIKFFYPFIPRWLFPFMSINRKSARNLKVLHSFTRKIIHEKIEERKNSSIRRVYDVRRRNTNDFDVSIDENIYLQQGKKRLAFMDLLIDHYLDQEQYPEESKLNIEDIREEVDTFMFEGFDTTAAAISWTIFYVGHYPEVQERLFEELRSLPLDEPYDVEMLTNLKYTEACIKEALRMYPSVPIIARKLQNPLQIENVRIPANQTLVIYVYLMHRDPKIFENPEQFQPERFMNPENRFGFAYIPFSAGHRNCIGQKFAMMEAKLMVAHIFRHFHVQSTLPLDQLDYAIELITRPKCPLKAILTARDE